MLLLQGVAYTHPDKDLLFNNINIAINWQDKIALIGNNGSGKSTLLKIMAGNISPSAGKIKRETQPYYVPQHFGQYNDYTIAQVLGVDDKLKALKEILAGNVTDTNMARLNDDWAIEERCNEALAYWKLDGLNLSQKMNTISGGQKTKVFLSGIMIHKPQLVLLDEPSNHVDNASRGMLYNYIQTTATTLVVVSHDITLLNLLNNVYELSNRGITVYGGNYDFYTEQKAIELNAFNEELKSREKALRKAKETEREALERQQKLDARGKKKQEKSGLPTIAMNTLRNKAERSTAYTKAVHAEKTSSLSNEIAHMRKELPAKDKMKIGFDNSDVHKGKVLVEVKAVNFSYGSIPLWKEALSFTISSGERIAIKGPNGSGKTTLVKMMLNEIKPLAGTINGGGVRATYIDQDYSLIEHTLTVYEQAQKFNTGNIQEHELKSRLTHFLFTKSYWDKSCAMLSGGEKMRLMLCCLTIGNQARDMIILDEPTNNLDIQNIEILIKAINGYDGTVIVISHDEYFLEQVKVHRAIVLP